MNKYAPVTFALLDGEHDAAGVKSSGEDFPLPTWYRKVRDVPLDELGLEDVARACRQQIHLNHTVPLALKFLETDPLSGEMYDGELLVSLNSVPVDFWHKELKQAAKLKAIIGEAMGDERITDDVREDAQMLLNTISAA